MKGLDYSVLGKIRNCNAASALQGVCTNACENHKTCKIPRKPLVIRTGNFKTGKSKLLNENALSLAQFQIENMHLDSYINGIYEGE